MASKGEDSMHVGYGGIAVMLVQVAVQDYLQALKDISAFENDDERSVKRKRAITNTGVSILRRDGARKFTEENVASYLDHALSTARYEAALCEKFLREECEMLTGYDGEVFIIEAQRQLREWRNGH